METKQDLDETLGEFLLKQIEHMGSTNISLHLLVLGDESGTTFHVKSIENLDKQVCDLTPNFHKIEQGYLG